ncbi:RNA polymerase sigma factor [Emticicia sp. 17c]|uniref:RNA polymerase sigma factor n=1 Tax=Emticicia sp. 17c TaxID=3127704 RepID=UPI00301D18EB
MDNNTKLHDSVLWYQLRNSEENAFSLLFERYYNKMVNYGKTLTSSLETAKDCVQDVFVDIWIYRHKLNENVVVKAYLLSCVRKRIANAYKYERTFSYDKDLDSLNFSFDFSIESEIILQETIALKVKRLNILINRLTSRQKEALYLRYHQGLSVEQISEILNLNYQSTKNLLHRAILDLRKEFLILLLTVLLMASVNSCI